MRLFQYLTFSIFVGVLSAGCDFGSYEQSDSLDLEPVYDPVLVGYESTLSIGGYSPRLFSTEQIPFDIDHITFEDPSLFEIVEQETFNDGESYQITIRARAPGETTFHADITTADGDRITNSATIRATDSIGRVKLQGPCAHDENPANVLFNPDKSSWLYATPFVSSYEYDYARIYGDGPAESVVSMRTEPTGQIRSAPMLRGSAIEFELNSAATVHVAPKGDGDPVILRHIAPAEVDKMVVSGIAHLPFVGREDYFSVGLFAGTSEICSIDTDSLEVHASPAEICTASARGNGEIHVKGRAKGQCAIEVSLPGADAGRGLSIIEQVEVGAYEP